MSSWAHKQKLNQSPHSSVPTDEHPPKPRPTGQGFCQDISSSLHSSLDQTQINLITLSVSSYTKCSLFIFLLSSYLDTQVLLTDVSLFVSDVVHFPKPTESESHVENPGNDYVLG